MSKDLKKLYILNKMILETFGANVSIGKTKFKTHTDIILRITNCVQL